MKTKLLLLSVFISVNAIASDQVTKIDFEKITTKQLVELNEKCLNNDYKGDDCKQLKQYQKEQREKGQKAAEQLLKHSNYSN
ncbi:hypothetical protein [Acinetobacter courvalinii]|uniref:Secreted protein n=1 Tax=Acinetobacter courvalinii TaxID=280147 RepID=A0AA42LDQ6_9GAMM|nr:hypothetical protein [Acinetobacter courvalinii]MDH0563020.1 hypothetical protein [Acinetobacter courvalinii]